jgi:hypothetical protein
MSVSFLKAPLLHPKTIATAATTRVVCMVRVIIFVSFSVHVDFGFFAIGTGLLRHGVTEIAFEFPG